MSRRTGDLRRIHIVGGPGSGKTTLAKRVAGLLGVPAYDLDTIAYEGGAGHKRDLERRRADVYRLAETPGWVTEGIYLWWCEPLARGADLIVWLDVPWSVAAVRIICRHLLLRLAGNNPHGGVSKLVRFVWHARRYYLARELGARIDAADDAAITRIATQEWLEPYAAKVRRCRRRGDLEPLLAELSGFAPG